MTSNRMIVVILVIFTVVGVIGQFANYRTTALVYESGDDIVVQPDPGGIASFIERIPLLRSVITAARTAIQNTALASSLFFLTDILTFSVPGMPGWLSLVFDLLLFLLCIAVVRVIIGTLAGGAG